MNEDKPIVAAGQDAPKQATNDKPKKKYKGKVLKTKIFAPFKVHFEGEAKSVSAVNESGPFDILPGHRNFITMLITCDVVVHTAIEDEKRTFKITRGLMHVRDNSVTVFLDV